MLKLFSAFRPEISKDRTEKVETTLLLLKFPFLKKKLRMLLKKSKHLRMMKKEKKEPKKLKKSKMLFKLNLPIWSISIWSTWVTELTK
jgi:hypothetical protein